MRKIDWPLAIAATFLFIYPVTAADLRRPDAPPDAAMSHEDREAKSACDEAIANWAKQFDPINIDTTVTGSVQEAGKDKTAVLDVKIDYRRKGGAVETRQAKIECTVRGDGSVAVKESGG